MPKQQQDLGVSAAGYGLLMSAFMIAGAVGGVLGSFGADRLGIRNVLAHLPGGVRGCCFSALSG